MHASHRHVNWESATALTGIGIALEDGLESADVPNRNVPVRITVWGSRKDEEKRQAHGHLVLPFKKVIPKSTQQNKKYSKKIQRQKRTQCS